MGLELDYMDFFVLRKALKFAEVPRDVALDIARNIVTINYIAANKGADPTGYNLNDLEGAVDEAQFIVAAIYDLYEEAERHAEHH